MEDYEHMRLCRESLEHCELNPETLLGGAGFRFVLFVMQNYILHK